MPKPKRLDAIVLWISRFLGLEEKEWQVLYPEGGLSVPMTAKRASDYAYIFNCKVVRAQSKGGK